MRSTKLAWFITASLALAATSGAAYAQQSAAAAEEEEGAGQTADIVILATPRDQIRIDRRTYTVRDDPAAQSTNMFEILGRIPSVSVDPGGDVRLLGAANVVIQIDGQPVPGANLEQVLRGLQGREVERIEVITNPSAQYSAQASGGIINIITRNRFESGFNGSVQTSLDNFGGYHAGFGPSWQQRRWSLSGQAGVFGGDNENQLSREREILPAGPLLSDEGLFRFGYDGWYASRLRASYMPDPRRRYTLTLNGGEFDADQRQRFTQSDASGPLFTSARDGAMANQHRNVNVQFNQQGETPREFVRLEASLSSFANNNDSAYLITPAGAGPASGYQTFSAQRTESVSLELQRDKPLPEGRFISYGASANFSDQLMTNRLASGFGAAPPAYDMRLDGSNETLAAYLTFQFDTGDWTWLPGLRAESYSHDLTSTGQAAREDDLRLFPSLHIRRALTPNINIDLSYTSRIQRPDFSQLDPALRFGDADRAFAGNPNLRPSTTDAFEANFIYQRSGASFSVTFFDRISQDIFSQFTEVTNQGIILTMPVNAGESEQRGLQAMLRGPLGRSWRYSLSGNVLSREFDYLSGAVLARRSEIEYDGIAQLDYREPDQETPGADQVQFELRFQGPRYGLQTETDPFIMANFTWRRRLTQSVFGVLSVQDIFDSTNRINEIRTDAFTERSEFRSQGARVRLGLTVQFGSGPQRQPPVDQPPPGPMPM